MIVGLKQPSSPVYTDPMKVCITKLQVGVGYRGGTQ